MNKEEIEQHIKNQLNNGYLDISNLFDEECINYIKNMLEENNRLKSKINQQDQIIREARELVTSRLIECEEYNCCGMPPEHKEELLEILDRNVNNE